MSFVFDSGYMFGISLSQSGIATPVKIGSMQGIEAAIDFTLNPSPMQFQVPIGQAIDKVNFSFTAKMAQVNGLLVNQLVFGQALTSGSQNLARDVAGTIPATGPYTITPTVPSSGTWNTDLGVQFNASGLPLTKVTSGPTTGQYSVSAGVYTFAAADHGLAVVINYLYNLTTGNNLVYANSFKKISPYFQVVLQTQYNGKQITWNMNRCASSSFKLATTITDFSVPNFKFTALADQSNPTTSLGTVGTFSFSD